MQDKTLKFESLLFSISRYLHRGHLLKKDEPLISFPQIVLLRQIKDLKSPKMKDLAKELRVTLSNVSGLVDRLFLLGYVKRINDQIDRRVMRITLTPKGKNVCERISEETNKCVKKLFSKISKKDVENLISIMQKLVNEINKEEEKK